MKTFHVVFVQRHIPKSVLHVQCCCCCSRLLLLLLNEPIVFCLFVFLLSRSRRPSSLLETGTLRNNFNNCVTYRQKHGVCRLLKWRVFDAMSNTSTPSPPPPPPHPHQPTPEFWILLVYTIFVDQKERYTYFYTSFRRYLFHIPIEAFRLITAWATYKPNHFSL